MALTTARFNNEEPEIERPESSGEPIDSELSTNEKLVMELKDRVSALEAQLNGKQAT